MKRISIFIILGCGLGLATLWAQNYKGADAILKTLLERSSLENGEPQEDAVSSLMKEIEVYRSEATKMAPADAANRWLAFYEAYCKIPQQTLYSSQYNHERLSIQSLLASLPPSAAWPELKSLIHKKIQDDPSLTNEALRLLSSVLSGNFQDQIKAVELIQDQIQKQSHLDKYLKQHLVHGIQNVKIQMIATSGSDADQLEVYEAALKAHESNADENNKSLHYNIHVPALVKIVGKEKAQQLLLRHFKTQLALRINDEETKTMAIEVALAHLNDIKQAPWGLVEGPEQTALFEALQKKFPEVDERNQYEKTQAQLIYTLSLIVQDRAEEAVSFLETLAEQQEDGEELSFPYEPLEELQKQGHGKKVLAFLQELLEKRPALPLWEAYISLSARHHSSKEALALQKEILAKPDLDTKAREIIEPLVYKGLLAADEIDEGIKILRHLINTGTQDLKNNVNEEEKLEMIEELLEQCLQLAEMGKLLQRQDLLDEGLQTALNQMDQLNEQQIRSSSFQDDLIIMLANQKKGDLAEAMIQKRLKILAKAQQNPQLGYVNIGEAELSALAWLYHREGRHADVLKILDEYPYWKASDLIDLTSSSIDGTTLFEMAAKALMKTDDHKAAKKIIHYRIKRFPNDDSFYQLLMELGGSDVMPFLDELIKMDPFQERPLIWKAKMQLDAGELDLAETTIRKAISIDPSDGEQGKGDRMRAYAVLADILEKKGDAEQAGIMRGAVKAIRLSEDADDWWNAGLLTQAVKRYEDALLHFADAYCIQSRLALRYSELGEFDKAEQHYRRAYELMPDSFGRIESHCFGCEGAFKGERAQNVADQVFTKLAQENPEKAQVFYLLGYLREAQGRTDEAADHYRKAIQLDQDYLNAITRLMGLTGVTAEEREKMILELLRIDPLQRHSKVRLEGTKNLTLLWDVILQVIEKMPEVKVEKDLYPLKASRLDLEKEDPQRRIFHRGSSSESRSPQLKLRDLFVSHHLIQLCASLMDSMSRHTR